MTLGAIIIEYRNAHKLSQRQFAAICGLTNGFISMIESERNPNTSRPISPSLSSLRAIATAMNMSLQDLLELADDTEICFDAGYNWSKHFRASLSAKLNSIDAADAHDAGIDIEQLHHVVDDTQPITLDAACSIADSLGISLDKMVTAKCDLDSTGADNGLSDLDVKILTLLQSIPEDKKIAAVEYLHFLSNSGGR